MQALARLSTSEEAHGELPVLRRRPVDAELSGVIPVAMPQETVLGEALGPERARHELRRTQQPVGERVLALLPLEPLRDRVVRTRRVDGDAQVAAYLLDRRVGEPGVRVRALEQARHVELTSGAERPLGTERPAVDEIDLAGETTQHRGGAGVVQPDGAHESQRPKRDLDAEHAQRLDHPDAGGQRSFGAGAHDGDGAAVISHADDLVPGGRAYARRAEAGGKRVQEPHAGQASAGSACGGLELVCAGVRCAGACLSLAVRRRRVLRAAGVDRR